MEKDLVSVLMVNYNHADTIEKAVKSVLNQTYPKVQLIIVDDGSTDDSVEIVKNIKDSRIELYRRKCKQADMCSYEYWDAESPWRIFCEN
ncbi:MAG: glycosyltransferase family 2 protein [Dorea sp.]